MNALIDSFSALPTGILVFLVLILLTVVAGYAFCVWKVFEKAGQPGWTAIIPIYSSYILTQIIGKPWWWVILMCFSFIGYIDLIVPLPAAIKAISFIGLIWNIWALSLFSKSFGKGNGFTIGLFFLGFIFFPIMAFNKSIQYQGPAGKPSAALNDQVESIGADIK